VHPAKNHPLVDGNKRVAFVCMVEFLARNGRAWTPPPGDEDGRVSAAVILDTAAGPGDAAAVGHLADWVQERIAPET
jgi:death-on-curing protein